MNKEMQPLVVSLPGAFSKSDNKTTIVNVFAKNDVALLIEAGFHADSDMYFSQMVANGAVLRLSKNELKDIAEIISEAMKEPDSSPTVALNTSETQ